MNTLVRKNQELASILEVSRVLTSSFDLEADFEFYDARQRRGLFMMTNGCLKHKVVKVAEAGGEIVGMASAQTLISTAEGSMAAIVEDVVVRPGFRRQGTGRRLVQSLCEWAVMRGVSAASGRHGGHQPAHRNGPSDPDAEKSRPGNLFGVSRLQ
ncbi:N-acetyltransferase family protein [Desulfosalsimonas sp.]|uniref:GNAT family N-acetyltransferase n=1 Tax=Desulfosalsimonas sp. TaxID=3073848 RepID=UPI003970F55A